MFVLRSGGIYTPAHAEALARQVDQWLPGAEISCLSDLPTEHIHCIPLKNRWPGWWSKMEMFRPDIRGDIFYLDLDTLVVESLRDIASVDRLMVLRDFYRDGVRRTEGLQSSVMMLPESYRRNIWEIFASDPRGHMNQHMHGGDQRFLELFWLKTAGRWQDVLPGQIVSLKVHCQHGIPSDARVVCAHGRPKFWELPEYQKYYE